MALFVYRQNIRQQQIGRIFRDRTNPLDKLTDEEVRARYRLDRVRIIELCGLIGNDVTRPTNRSQSLSVSLQVMMGSRYYATGSFLLMYGDIHGLTKMSVCDASIKFHL